MGVNHKQVGIKLRNHLGIHIKTNLMIIFNRTLLIRYLNVIIIILIIL